MNVCPICLFVNGRSASACARCGKFQFATAQYTAVSESPPPSGSTGMDRGDSPSKITKSSGIISAFLRNRESTEQSTGVVAFGLTKPAEGSQVSGNGSGAKSSRIVIRPRLEVVRGEHLGSMFQILEGRNVIGRTVNVPVDLDLTGQETPDRVWSSRQHACIQFDGRTVILEDLNSLNGTFVNRQRVFPGQQRVLQAGDVIQVGTVQLRLHIAAEKVEVQG